MLFDPITLRDLTVRNRVWMPPMCQYMVDTRDGKPTDWHLVHYGARAAQGFGLLVMEATGIVPEGRITPGDLGLWDDSQVEPFRRVVDFCHAQGAAVAVQLQHSGRKGSSWPDNPRFPVGVQPVDQGGWIPVGPGDEPAADWVTPRALTTAEVAQIPGLFAQAAIRADKAGIDVVEIHGAHGYLLHQFYSPLTNTRTDEYGGDFEGRTRLIREVTQAVRAVWPDSKPLFMRLSATDWTDGGWNGDDTVALAKELRALGVDLIDVSTGGNVNASIPIGPGYQVSFAQRVRTEADIPTTAVGLITEPGAAEQILRSGQADAVMIGREALRNPGWPEQAAAALGAPSPMAGPYRRGQAPRRK
ncbi:MAG: NADH:flavin oxidoreductase/NADH oxidase [Propionibacteriaceae bacterium]|jgi:2,4-dienoyl-CoA reductase-like NADH-dependent reductase (Old Yellow Enzyme family)|nr:NADH:flavin oxidoreductase/NADH oxidase [Propionibacteriaceae bacterium]